MKWIKSRVEALMRRGEGGKRGPGDGKVVEEASVQVAGTRCL